jgi:hypothetical protein
MFYLLIARKDSLITDISFQFLRDFFYADGGGLPLENLQNQKYRDIVSIRLYYDWDTCVLIS